MPDLNPVGLSEAEARRRLREEGPNELPSARRRGWLAIVFEVLHEPMFLLLVAGGAIYLALGSLQEALILLLSVFVVMGITIYQTRKTERALEALHDLSSPRALVMRGGEPRRIAGREVVRGDLLVLQEGDRVAADARLIHCNDLSVDEALLTGESLPVRKAAGPDYTGPAAPGGDDTPFVFSGTMAVQGQGVAQVIATGAHTQIGRIGKALQTIAEEQTPLQKQTGAVVRVFALFGLLLCAVVVALYAFTRGGLLDGVLAGITLAMAVLPEEFPMVLTVFLALGAWRISTRHVLTRRLPAIETLGAATVLCVDKTGTLTENEMAVSGVFAHGRLHKSSARPLPEAARLVARYAALASETEPFDPMERAIVEFAAHADPRAEAMRTQWSLVHEYPLSPQLFAMTHCWQRGQEQTVAVKGSPEAVADLCRLEAREREDLLAHTAAIAERGQRVLGVARASWRGEAWPADPRAFDWGLLGLIALSDPVRRGVRDAVRQCHDAGIRVVMVTGDYAGTARSVAAQVGLESPGGACSGPEIAAMGEADLRTAVARTNIFARMVPEQKLRLVEALKANGEIVAMTGDGVNDAPALKSAHIGVAMGSRGTDVARETAALVLLDDDFSSIVAAVRLGRRIYDNIRNAMCYLLAVHVPTAGMAVVPLLFGWPLVLFPVHIVFLEFVIDPACSIAFENEPMQREVMQRPPRDPKAPLFDGRMLVTSLLQGLTVLVAVGVLYWAALDFGLEEGRARAMAFAGIVLGNIGLILSNRSQSHSLFATLRTPNLAIWLVSGSALVGLLLALYVPALEELFKFRALLPHELAASVAAAGIGIGWFEALKVLRTVWGRGRGAKG
jgi:Ca2+-transporting ATPase